MKWRIRQSYKNNNKPLIIFLESARYVIDKTNTRKTSFKLVGTISRCIYFENANPTHQKTIIKCDRPLSICVWRIPQGISSLPGLVMTTRGTQKEWHSTSASVAQLWQGLKNDLRHISSCPKSAANWLLALPISAT